MIAHPNPKQSTLDPVWSRMRREAEDIVANEPLMASLVHAVVLQARSLETAVSYRLAQKLATDDMPQMLIRQICNEAVALDPSIGAAIRADIVAVEERDPACHRYIHPLLYFKGFLAIETHRIAHWLWRQGRRDLAYFFQMRSSEVFGVDIHPAARLGKGVMIDHAHSVVIGETAVVGDDVSMLHSVTLGGTGKAEEDRHPKIGAGVLLGAGAKILGNIRIGHCSRVAAGSVVLKDVPPCVTVAGVPAKIVGEAGCARPAASMDQMVDAADLAPTS